jgi:hypothetical protein
VQVVDRLEFQVVYHLVSDSANHQSQATNADVDAIATRINLLYENQANVTLRTRSINTPVYPTDLGQAVVRLADQVPPGVPANWDEWDYVTGRRDPSADFNVFLVWNLALIPVLRPDGQPDMRRRTIRGHVRNVLRCDTIHGLSDRANDVCVVEDLTPVLHAVAVAHELGHLFGLEHANHRPDQLMHADAQSTSCRLTRKDIETIRTRRPR